MEERDRVLSKGSNRGCCAGGCWKVLHCDVKLEGQVCGGGQEQQNDRRGGVEGGGLPDGGARGPAKADEEEAGA